MRAYNTIYLNVVENSSVALTLGAGDSTVASAERAAITSVTVAGHALAAVVSSASAITEGASSVTTTIAVIAADVASVVALVARSDGVGVRNTDADGGLVEGGRSIDGNLPGTGSHTVEGAIALEMRGGRGPYSLVAVGLASPLGGTLLEPCIPSDIEGAVVLRLENSHLVKNILVPAAMLSNDLGEGVLQSVVIEGLAGNTANDEILG